MKKLLLTFVLLVGIVFGLFAQKLTYQAVIRDNNQQLVVNTAVKATVTITFSTGNPYSEVVNGSTNVHGLLSFEFGDGTLNGRDWTGATIAVKVVKADDESTVYVNDDARSVSAVPYALSVNGQSIQNYLNEHHYVDLDKLNDTLSAYSTTAVMDGRHYLTSDSAVITTMQSDISRNAAAIGNLTLHTAKAAIRDSVAGQIHDSIAANAHTHSNKALLDTYTQTEANLADAVAKKHEHANMTVLNATTAPYTDADSIKLKGIAEGAEVNVQADWNQSTTTADDYIKNKPTIPTVPTNVSAFSNDAGYITNAAVPTNVSELTNDANYITAADVPAQVNADWNATEGAAKIINKPELFSGDYNDLQNKPALFDGDYNSLTNTPAIPTVPTNVSAFTNDAGYITNAAVPTNVSELTNDANYITAADVPAQVNADWNATEGAAEIINKPELFSGDYNDLQNKPALFDGDYNSLTNTPAIPTVPTNVSAFTNDAGYITNATVPTNVSELTNDANYITAADVPAQVNADWNATEGAAEILNKPELFSGDYNDLSNKPTIPAAANNATLTIQKNGTSVGTFTADASSDKSINITVPTTTSELTNNSGFITTANVPTNVSQLNNDAGYVSNSNCPTVDLCELYNMMTSLQNTIARQDSVINALNNELHPFVCGTSTVTDYDGNTYNTVQIGQQCWMKQNLKTTHYSDGTSISLGSSTSTTTAYRYNPDDNSSNVATYGYLYNWKAVMRNTSSSSSNPSGVQGICPTGWHVPSDAEWTQLKNYVSSQSQYVCGSNNTYIAKALASTTGWITSSTTCAVGNTPSNNNATGFSAVPAGTYDGYDGSYDNFGYTAYFWSATQGSRYSAYGRYLGYNLANVRSNSGYDKNNGYSVRCLRDASIGGGDNPSAPATMSCEDVMNCLGDTLGKLNTKIEAQGAEIETLNGTVTSQGQTIETLNSTVESQGNTIDSLAHLVDSLSNLTPGGGDEPATFTCGSSKVKDVDNNEYNTVAIGNQCWLKENLRTKTLQYGQVWTKTDVDSAIYGRYYDWQAAMQIEQGNSTSYTAGDKHRGICPAGWHVPSDAEWTALTDYVKSKSEYQCGGNAANIAKALSQPTGWSNTDTGCNAGNTGDKANATGFSAVPAGLCFYGSFEDFGDDACFWSATQDDDFDAWCRGLYSNASYVVSSSATGEYGFSVRCLRDAGVGGTPGENETGGTTPSAPATVSCEQVMKCVGDTLGRLNAKIEAQGAEIETLNGTVESQGNTIDSLAHLVDSLSNLTPGGEPTATFTCGSSKVKDVDLNEYPTVKIGNQCWMAQNLRTSTNTAGTGHIYTPTASEVPGYDVNTYGRLYDWAAVMQGASSSDAVPSGVQGICPTGWHVPSDAEWTQLTTYVKSKSEYQCDGADNIANALSAAIGWSYNTSEGCYAGSISSTINLTGFSAVPAGLYNVRSLDFSHSAFFWSTTEYDSNNAYYRNLSSNDAEVSRWDCSKDNGHSVRCLRDASIGGGDNPSEPATMSCEQVMQCMGDTLGRLNAKIEAQGNTIDTLAHLVDSLSNLAPGGEPTATFICGTSTVTDHEGNVYNTVQVGDQCWTKENMRCTTSPSTGTSILEYPASSYSYTGKKAYYPNGNSSNVATYGLLYNWCAAVDTFNTAYGETSTNTEYSNAPSVTFGGNRRGICPVGWHVPSDAEWTQLTTYVSSQSEYVCGSGNTKIGKALASTTGWNSYTGTSSNRDCYLGYVPANNNATGFSAVPAGNYSGSYGYFGNDAYFWSATQNTSGTAYNRYLYYTNASVGRYYNGEHYGFSVRCLRD